jgi:hypothetical protein
MTLSGVAALLRAEVNAAGAGEAGARDRAAGRRIECLLKVSLRLLEQTFS